jgi:hypothetical protein
MEFRQRDDQRNYIYRENDQINDIYGEGRSEKWNIGTGMMKWNFCRGTTREITFIERMIR